MFLMDAVHSTLSLAEVTSQIAETSNDLRSQHKERKLKRTELIEDIFNSSQKEGQEQPKKGGERLNLSHTSRVLLTEFQKRAEKFLDQHSDVAKNLEGVGLPDDEFLEPKVRRQGYWMARRLNRYWQWLNDETQFEASIDFNQPFLAVQSVGKDNAIRTFYQGFYQFYAQLIKEYEGGMTCCSYYYNRHPPAYRFN